MPYARGKISNHVAGACSLASSNGSDLDFQAAAEPLIGLMFTVAERPGRAFLHTDKSRKRSLLFSNLAAGAH